jgi:FkbM family methyltransferase
MTLAVAKQISISLGIYKQARALHRQIFRSEGRKFSAHRKLFSQFVNRDDLVFDVGANIGSRSEVLLSLGARVIAFEPQPICAHEIRARGNRRLTVVEAALGSSEGHADLHLKEANTQSSLLQGWEGTPDIDVLRVPVTTLDVSIKKFGIPKFCKIDAEGFEPEIFRGLSSPIPAMSFEYHCRPDDIASTQTCLGLISKLGKFSVNAIGEEGTDWILPKWISIQEFADTFPSCVQGHFYGDVYVRENN